MQRRAQQLLKTLGKYIQAAGFCLAGFRLAGLFFFSSPEEASEMSIIRTAVF